MVALRSNRPIVYPPVPAFGAPLTVRETDRAEATKPRLLDRVREAIHSGQDLFQGFFDRQHGHMVAPASGKFSRSPDPNQPLVN